MSPDEQDIPGPTDKSRQEKQRPGAWLALGALVTWSAAKAGITSVLKWLTGPPRKPARQIEQRTSGEGREKDRNLAAEPEHDLRTRAKWRTLLAVFPFFASFAGGIGFLVAYWNGGSNQALGGWLALFMFGWGAAFVLWSHWLTAHKEAVEPREEMTPPREEREATLHDFCAGEQDMQRRGLLKWLSVCGLGMFAVVFVSLFRSFGFNPGAKLFSEVWKRGQRLMKADGTPVRADALPPGTTVIVFPEDAIGSERSQTVLIRVRQELLQLPGDRADWAPRGYLAYSRVCTHAGCAVGMYETTAHLLMCPCHQSTFDVLKAAEPTGGPAARPLAQLPLYVDNEGLLRAGGDFSEPPGPGFWGMTS